MTVGGPEPARLPGRDQLLDDTWDALEAGGRRLLEGPAGIGKSTVLAAIADRARAEDWFVLGAAPTEVEQLIPYAALTDVLDAVADLVADLPPPQERAARAVIEGGSEVPVADGVVAAATRTLLQRAAVKYERVLLVLDDVVWLDPASARALEYAVRRVAVPVLIGRRVEGEPPPPPLALDRPVVGTPLEVVPVPPLDRDSLRTVLVGTAPTLPRHLRERIIGESEGNVLLAVELARAVLRLERTPQPDEDLPLVGSSVLDVARAAVAALPDPTVEALRLAALTTDPRLDVLAAAGASADRFHPAEAAGLVRISRGRTEFLHPMYAAAVRTDAVGEDRRRLHARLAAATSDPDERARQLARATAAPDEAVAAQLDAAAHRLLKHGAPDAAAGLWQRAAELSPARADRDRRSAMITEAYFVTGDYGDAYEIASRLAREATGEARAIALLSMASVVFFGYSADADPVRCCERALAEAPPGSRTEAYAHLHLAFMGRGTAVKLHHARESIRLLDRRDTDRNMLASACFCLFDTAAETGEYDEALIDRGIALEDGVPAQIEANLPGRWWRANDDHDRARDRFAFTREACETGGDDTGARQCARHLAITELYAGRLDAATAALDDAYRLRDRTDVDSYAEDWIAARIAATRGDLDRAHALLDPRLEVEDFRFHTRMQYFDTAAFTAWCAGDHQEAVRWCRRLQVALDGWDGLEQMMVRHEPVWVKAALAGGDVADAEQALTLLQARHARLPRPWTTLGVASSTLLLAAATGEDVGGPLAALAAVLAAAPEDRIPFDRAESLMVAGVVQRRSRQRGVARDHLTEAAAAFDRIGAVGFAARARGDLARVSGRGATGSQLSETERRVAERASDGATNVEIAAALFLSPKTVEAHLSRIYRKLGISRRAELNRALAAERD